MLCGQTHWWTRHYKLRYGLLLMSLLFIRFFALAALFYVGWWIYRDITQKHLKSAPRKPTNKPRKKRSPHEILGVPQDASPDDIRKAYQEQVQQYHPDRVAGMGKDLQQLAERRTKELNAAYEHLKRRT